MTLWETVLAFIHVTVLLFGLLLVTAIAWLYVVEFVPAFRKARNYLGNPSDNKLSLNCTMRQCLCLVSDAAGDRWYESRAVLRRSVFVSLLAAIKVVTVVRFDFTSPDDADSLYAEIALYAFWVLPSRRRLRTKMLEREAAVLKTQLSGKTDSLYQIFVAGDNVIWDWVNGDLCSHI